MARIKIIGVPFGTIDQPEEEFSEKKDGSQTIKRRYRTLFDSWLASAPRRGASHPRYPKAVLSERICKQMRPAFLCNVELVYQAPATENDGPPDPGAQLPVTRYEETSNYVEAPIQTHPKWPDWEQYWDYGRDDWRVLVPLYLQGVKTWIVGSVTESETRYSWGEPQSVSESVNQLSGGGHWMVISGSKRREGLYWSRTLNRIYSKTPFPAQIYSGL